MVSSLLLLFLLMGERLLGGGVIYGVRDRDGHYFVYISHLKQWYRSKCICRMQIK